MTITSEMSSYAAFSRGETILGYTTKTEFCDKALKRNIRTVQYLLQDGRPNAEALLTKGHANNVRVRLPRAIP